MATLCSTKTNAIRQPTPAIKLPKTSGSLQPRLTDSIKPKTRPPNPAVARIAPDPINVSGTGAAAFCNAPNRNGYHSRGQREIDEEDPSPGGMLNQPAAQQRSSRCGDRGKARPGSNRPAAILLVEGCADNGKTPGHEKCCPDALNTSCDYQLMNVCGEAAACGSQQRKSSLPPGTSDVGQTGPPVSRQQESAHQETVRKIRLPIAHPPPSHESWFRSLRDRTFRPDLNRPPQPGLHVVPPTNLSIVRHRLTNTANIRLPTLCPETASEI